MSVRVNLLPRDYLRNHQRRARFRAGVIVGTMLLGVEVITGIVLHARAQEARSFIEAERMAGVALREVKQQSVEPGKKASRLHKEMELARRLRTTHRWSRLFSLFAQNVPDRVLLKSISTDPPRWARVSATTVAQQQSSDDIDSEPEPPASSSPVSAALNGIVIQGIAADHGNLSELIAAMNRLNAFSSVNLREAGRGSFLGQDAITFQMECRW